MTAREENGKTTVSLSPGNWLGFVGTVATALVTQAWLFHARVITLESQSSSHEKRLDGLEQQDRAIESLIREEFRALRTELKQ